MNDKRMYDEEDNLVLQAAEREVEWYQDVFEGRQYRPRQIMETSNIIRLRYAEITAPLANTVIHAGTPGLCEVTVSFRNHSLGEVETNFGRMLISTYSHAFRMARRRQNFFIPGTREDRIWRDDGEGPIYPAYRHITYGFPNSDQVIPNHPIPVDLHVGNRRRNAHASVRCIFRNVPYVDNRNDEFSDADFSSNNVDVVPNSDQRTCQLILASMIRKHMHYRWSQGSQPVVDPQERNAENVQIVFVFHFYRDDGWRSPGECRYLQRVDFEDHVEEEYGADNYDDGEAPEMDVQPVVRRPRRYVRERQALGIRHPVRYIAPQPRQRRPPIRYIANFARGRVRGETVDTMYAKLKDRIYVRRSLGDFFQFSKACIGVPFTEEGYCFPMAFMRCECRRMLHPYPHNMSVLDIQEGFRVELEIPEDVEIPFQGEYSFFKDRKIVVWDNTKKPNRRQGSHGKLTYINEAMDLPVEEVAAWEWCAKVMHGFVADTWGSPVDAHDLDLCMKAYSYAFEVHISVFATEMKGERVYLEKCQYEEGFVPPYECFVGLVLQGEHMHAISHMRHYQRSDVNANETCLASYCDMCNTLKIAGRTKRKRSETNNGEYTYEMYPHQSQCSQDPEWGKCKDLEDLHMDSFRAMNSRKVTQYTKDDWGNYCYECCRIESDQPHEKCHCENPDYENVHLVQCMTCLARVPDRYYNDHVCYMRKKSDKGMLDESKLYVYDMEARQEKVDAVGGHSVHTANLIYLMGMYDTTREFKFMNVGDFVHFLLDDKDMHGAILWAHNGGAYDVQFVLRYLEDNNIAHECIPRPGTVHKYLEVKIVNKGGPTSIFFRDFLMFMTDSLRNVGKAFKLDVCKGDFPHKFSTLQHETYEGSVPNPCVVLRTPEEIKDAYKKYDPNKPEDRKWRYKHDENDAIDWYGFRKFKSEDEMQECMMYWYDQCQEFCACFDGPCNCDRKKWNYRVELEKYCRLDVIVLAAACRKYRDQFVSFKGGNENWTTKGIDPFNYMTQSQCALSLFTHGLKKERILITQDAKRQSFRAHQIEWMEDEMADNPQYDIWHLGNHYKEWYDEKLGGYLDGYCRNTGTAFEYFDCYNDACPLCYGEEVARKEPHPDRYIRFDLIARNTDAYIKKLKDRYGDRVKIRWTHDMVDVNNTRTESEVMDFRAPIYGGRTEVLAAYVDIAQLPGWELKKVDVSSLYPHVCAKLWLPIGKPTKYFKTRKVNSEYAIDRERLNNNHPDSYQGFVRCKVRPNRNDFIAILPERKGELGEEKLIYDLYTKVGTWHTELIYLALEHGYEVSIHIYVVVAAFSEIFWLCPFYTIPVQ